MNLLASLMRALGWPPPAVHVPTRRHRFIKATCEFCGKQVAVTSGGKFWKHNCGGGWHSSVPPDLRVEAADEAPDQASLCPQHDTWDEHEGRR